MIICVRTLFYYYRASDEFADDGVVRYIVVFIEKIEELKEVQQPLSFGIFGLTPLDPLEQRFGIFFDKGEFIDAV